MTCASCTHWHEHPIDPQDVGAPRPGDCRLNPPTVIPLRGPQGLQLTAAYPVVPAEFPACSKYQQRSDA